MPVVVSPPVMPGVMPPASAPVWPTVIGVIAAVLGAMGALGGAWGIVGSMMMGWLPAAMPKLPAGQPDPTQFFKVMLDWRPWLIAVSTVTLLVALWLLCGGILLMMRHAAARPALIWWSVAKMALVVGASAVNYQVNQAQMAAMQQSGGMLAGMSSMMGALGAIGMAVSIAWGWALPVFMLTWMLRPRIRQQVAAWHSARA
jgi:hypothetical protein